MKILCDFHHEDLFYSLHLLFEKRMGYELYRQIGPEWYQEGYWLVYDHPATVSQYLGIQQAQEWAAIKAQNANMYCTIPNENAYQKEDGIFLIPDFHRNVVYKAVTLEKFKQMKFDIVVSSMPAHIDRFNKLISSYQPHAKHIFQVGNNWGVGGFNVKNILSSSTKASPNPDQHCVYYHQEFDLTIFDHQSCPNPKSVVNMMHIMSGDCLGKFNQFKAAMPDWKWTAHGGGNADGPATNIPQAFKDHGFLWHYKREGDGFGYNMFNALATGRPIITRKSFFKGMTVDPLLVDGVSCIDLDVHSVPEVIKMLNEAAQDHARWSMNTYNHFKSLVDYDREAVAIKAFLDNLK